VRSKLLAVASSDVASYPLVANEASAASRMRSLVARVGTYQMVDRFRLRC
jgi:hypothetical protein